MIQELGFGWSLGALSILIIQQLWDSWDSYRKDLKLARCNCKGDEE